MIKRKWWQKQMFKFVLVVVASVQGSHVFASQRVGNGGFLAVCADRSSPPIYSSYLLDYFDGAVRFAQLGKINLGPAGSPEDMARFALTRLARLDPIRSQKYLAELDRFFEPSNLAFLPASYVLPVAADAGETMIPTNCHLVQAAANTIPTQAEEPKYWILEPLWNNLDDIGKAGLIIHEIVYNDALVRGQTTSEHARYFTYLISSERIGTLTQSEYNDRVLANGMTDVSFRNLNRNYNQYRYFDSARLNYKSAKEFCEKLPGISYLAQSFHFADTYFLQSAISKFILNHEEDHEAVVWVNHETLTRTFKIDERTMSNSPADEDPNALHPFVCIVEANTNQ